jgi:solute carrier family 6 GABA transporter-like protein 1
MTVCLIAIPVLVLEIAIGQAYRGGSVVAYNTMHHRLKGTGLNLIYVGFVVGPYFAVNLGESSWSIPQHDSVTYALFELG